jgi:diaminohydroxyphosphoribosylaminopyrimidine deaminase/5-amino-6-(5-phosphoribosylamino)uracil reductase
VKRAAEDDRRMMARALALASLGQGSVEPNPPVGCVIVKDGRIVGEGFHHHFGGPHAEVVALEAAGAGAAGATVYVTLEPCCHQGKTPPCTQALIRAGVARAVIAELDPFPQVNGRGLAELRAAGIDCEINVLAEEATYLLGPYLRLLTSGRPWLIAKWAMSLDGKIATRGRDSRWISSEPSRRIVHQLRGRVDAIVVGSETARVDDPLLTARPEDRGDLKRVATRIVVDSAASLAVDSRLVQTAGDVPVLVAAAADALPAACERLRRAGVEVFLCEGGDHPRRLESLLAELGRRRMTNVLVEGGGRLLGALFDMRAVDEVHAFIAPRIIGGDAAPSPVAGIGANSIAESLRLSDISIEELDGDVYVQGRVTR